MRVIFLDIDGVLNSTFWNEENQKELSDGKLVDETKVKLLAEIVKKTNAMIVLHSGWRFWFDDLLNPIRDEAKYFVSILEHNGLKVYDKTPDLTTEEIRRTKKFSLVKAQEILMWIGQHKDIETYIMIDDLDLNNDVIQKSLIRTDSTNGLSEENVLDAIECLNQ